MNKSLSILAQFVKQNNIKCSFKIIEIGALHIHDQKEPFYELLDHFPSSEIIGFEVEKEVLFLHLATDLGFLQSLLNAGA